ncbi:DNA-3-methyladenine glycosylase [Pseudomonas sp. F1_0610]|uniref:DNA-3-methyladenine glycosylase n=1 Tax=Pseudomonas sp. F1_0610 TaxID=3114284 RepID=UPI0039C06F99
MTLTTSLPWQTATPLATDFFNQDALTLAKALLGKVIRHRFNGHWLSVRIIETEAYLLSDKGSHASLGYTEKRKALFMDGGIIYMYYARGGDSLNFSAKGAGNAVLIKSAFPYFDAISPESSLSILQENNPNRDGSQRSIGRLCAGQTLLCRSLGLKVPDWDAQPFDTQRLFVDDCALKPATILQTKRLGIPQGRDEDLPYRFVDSDFAPYCTKNPLRRGQIENQDYRVLVNL